jgi:ubiquinol-cytochrome c reductase cytochrome b subunit
MLPDAQVVPGMPSFVLFDGELNSYLWLTRIATLYYFAFFLVVLPYLGLKEVPLKIPASISEPVLKGSDAMTAAAPAAPEKKG